MADAPDAAPPARSNGSESPAPEPVAEPEPVPTALCPVCNLPEHPPATKYTASGEVVTVQCLLGPTRPAIFASKRCVGCDQKIEIGQSISYALGMWVHAMCGVKLLHPSTPSAEELIAKIETHTTNAEFVRVLEVVFTAQGHIMILATAGTGKTTVLSILVKIVSAEMAIACMFAKMNVVHAFEKGIIFASTYHSICFRAMGSALRSNTSSAWSWDSAIIDDDDSISVLSMEMHVAALMQQIYPISHAGNSRTNKALNELFNPSVAKAVNLGMQQCFGLPNGPIVNTANFRKLFDEFHITHELHELWDADKVDMEAVDDYLRMHYNIELHPEDAEGNDIQDHVHNNGEFSITCALTEFAIMLTKRIFIGMVDSFWTGAFEGHTQMMYLDANLQQEILPVGACSFTLVVYLVVKQGLTLVKRWFKFLLLEEIQDMTPLYMRVVQKMLFDMTARRRPGMPATRIIMVGDQRQLITGFQGADNNACTSLMNQYMPYLMSMNECKRCSIAVIDNANKYMLANADTFKDMSDKLNLLMPAPGASKGMVLDNVSYFTHPPDNDKSSAVLTRNNKEGKAIFFTNVSKRIDCSFHNSNAGTMTVRGMLLNELKYLEAKKRFTLTAMIADLDQRKSSPKGRNVRAGFSALIDQILSEEIIAPDNRDAIFHVGNYIRANFKEDPLHQVMTVHASKGLEFHRVYGVQIMQDIPSFTSLRLGGEVLNGEKRLMFVFLTRAKEELLMVESVETLYGEESSTSTGEASSSTEASTPATLSSRLVRTIENSSKRIRRLEEEHVEALGFPTNDLTILNMDALPPTGQALKIAVANLKSNLNEDADDYNEKIELIDTAATSVRTYMYARRGPDPSTYTPASSQE